MRKTILAGVAGVALISGCALSFKRCHQSLLIEVYTAGVASQQIQRSLPLFEDAVVLMADEFGVPLEDVIPVQVYIDENSSSRSYYNRLTHSIVLRGSADPSIFVHEMSHLLSHRLGGSPPYWIDEALAMYMEARFSQPKGNSQSLLALSRFPSSLEENVAKNSHHLARCVAGAWDSSEILDHLTPRAVDEDRSWGLIVVRYFFERRWAGRPTSEKIRGFLKLSRGDVAACASEILEFCRRRESPPGPLETTAL